MVYCIGLLCSLCFGSWLVFGLCLVVRRLGCRRRLRNPLFLLLIVNVIVVVVVVAGAGLCFLALLAC